MSIHWGTGCAHHISQGEGGGQKVSVVYNLNFHSIIIKNDCQLLFLPDVDFINILHAAFLPILFRQIIKKQNVIRKKLRKALS